MPKTVDHYLSLGFDKKTAEYFASGRRTISSVKANDNYTLTIRFDSGEIRLYDASPLLKEGSVSAFLTDINRFKSVYLDDAHCISWDIDPNVDSEKIWSNKIDLCPDSCYIDSIPIENAE